MYSLYRIINNESGNEYIGMTKKSIAKRFSEHKYTARSGKKSKLYDAMRSYGAEAFSIELIETFCTRQECSEAEISAIANGKNLYNLAAGGDGGFTVSNIEEWKAKLKIARAGAKPALGMKHTEENKKFFGECNKRKPLKYNVELPPTFKEAHSLLGISKTHYYRLVRRAESNDLS